MEPLKSEDLLKKIKELEIRNKELESKSNDLIVRSKVKIEDLTNRLEDFKKGENKVELYTAMFKAKGELSTTKSGQVIGNFSYKFFSFDDVSSSVDKALSKYELLCVQGPIHGGAIMLTEIIHTPTGQKLEFTDKVILGNDKDKNKARGSGFTYAKKYSLISIFGINDKES